MNGMKTKTGKKKERKREQLLRKREEQRYTQFTHTWHFVRFHVFIL
jgi:hypothetical protein